MNNFKINKGCEFWLLLALKCFHLWVILNYEGKGNENETGVVEKIPTQTL